MKAGLVLLLLASIGGQAWAIEPFPTTPGDMAIHAPSPTILPAGLRLALFHSLAKDANSGYDINKTGCEKLPGQLLKACFKPEGASFSSAGMRSLALRLNAYGRGNRLEPVAPVRPVISRNQARYRHGSITEWWRVLPVGFEQGFTLARRPAGKGKLKLALVGNRTAERKGQALSWGNLRYGKLVVTDATGRTMPSRLENDGHRILISVDDTDATYPLTVDPLVWLEQEVAVDDPAKGDMLGYSTAIEGNTALIGAAYSTVGDNSQQGAVFVFTRSNGTWTQSQKLTAGDGAAGDLFGWSADLDGDTAVIGARKSSPSSPGAAYVFSKMDGSWKQTAKLVPGDSADGDQFGGSVAVSGNVILVGAADADVNGTHSQGATYVFGKSGSGWTQTTKLTANDGAASDFFGYAVALDNDTALIGAEGKSPGAAYVFTQSGGSWAQTAELKANGVTGTNFFGESVALDGSTAVIGAPFTTVQGTGGAGAAYIFRQLGGAWTQTGKLTSNDPRLYGSFGAAVAIEGNTAVVGADDVILYNGPGIAYAFKRSGGAWTQIKKFLPGDNSNGDLFGYAIDIDRSTILIGAPHAAIDGNVYQGSAYFYAQPNLALAINAPERVNLDSQFVATTFATNNSSATSPAVAVSIAVPAAASFVSAAASQGNCSETAGVVRCQFGAIAGNAGTAKADVTLKALGKRGGIITSQAEMLHAQPALSAKAATAVNRPPVARGARVNNGRGQTVSGNLKASDADGDPLVFSIVTQPKHGNVELLDADKGVYTYTPDSGYVGADQFSFKANDGYADSNVASMIIYMANQPPVASDGTLTTDKNTKAQGTLKAKDPDGDSLVYRLVTPPAHGIVTLDNDSGNYSYAPADDYFGKDSFTFEANDGQSDSNVATISITVEGSAPPPPPPSNNSSGGGGFGGLLLALLAGLVATATLLRRLKRNQGIPSIRKIHGNDQKEATMRIFKPRTMAFALMLAGVMTMALAPPFARAHDSATLHQSGATQHTLANARKAGTPSHLVKIAPQSSTKLLSQATQLGPHSPNSIIKLTVALKLRNASKLKSFLEQVQNPSSATYHQWLTPAEFTRLYGPSQADVTRVIAYLKAHGIRVLDVSSNRMLIHTEASTGVYEHAFGIRINDYKLNGRRFYSSADSPILPRSLAPVILSVMGLNRGALMRPMHHKETMLPNAETTWPRQARPDPDPSVYLSQDQFAKAYDWPSVTDPNHGAGVTIAVLSFASANLLASDYQTYWDEMGVPGHQVTIDDDIDGTPATGAEGETTLDIEYSGYMAPGANIILYEGSQAYNYAFADVFNKLVTDNIAAVASISWGGCDSTWPSSSLDTIEQIIQQAVAQGISISAAAGDSGAAAPRVCDSGSSNALYPASSPYVLDANGTNLTVTDNSGTYGSETAWSGTGGGDSHAFSQPDWQTGPGVPDSGDRMTGDMAMHAGGKGLLFYFQGTWTAGSVGTSFVSPEFAGLFAIANSMNGARLGQSNTLIYGDVNGGHYATDFRDVTTGSNGHPAGPNWDYPTGWGSPNAENLLSHIGIQGPKGTLEGEVTDAASGAPIANAKILITASDGRHFATRSTTDGSYSRVLPAGDFTVNVSSFGYADGTASVSIADGKKTDQDFALNAAPQATLSGTVSDDSGHGYGLYANLKISTEGFGQVADVWTDPRTGQYSVNLPKGNKYTLKVAAAFNGYDTASDTVTLSGNKTRDFPLDITTTCTAPGYRFESGGLHADFNGTDFPPPGWMVKTPQGDINWIPNSQQPFWNGNYTGGTGEAANADSYSTTDAYDTSLVTPPIAVTSLDGATVLRYKANYQPFSDTEALDLDITTNDGQTWTTLEHWNSAHGAFADTPGVTVQLDLAQYLPTQGDFRLRWRYYNPVNGRSLSDYYAEIDDIVIGDCRALDGGLVTGQATDSNTGEGIIGVRVQDEAGNATRTLVNPDDPDFPAGSYLFFARAGKQTLTASKAPFSPATAQVTIKKNAIASQDFVLKSARIEANPQTLAVHVKANGSGTVSFALKNTGSGAGQFKITAINAPPASTAPSHDYNVPLMHGTPVPDPAWMSASLSWIRTHAESGNFRMKSALEADSDKGAWQAIADYPHAVGDNFAARDDITGKVYVVGGVIGGQMTASGFVYDPKEDDWTPIADAPIARNAAGIGFIDGKLYVSGGWDLRGQPATELDIYDPAGDTWSTGAPDPAGQGGGVAHAVLNGQLYLVGGCNNDACDSPLSAVETYDPARDSWIALPDYPQTVAFAACGAIEGKLYCAGGLSGSTVSAGGYVYNPASRQWSPIAEMPYPAGAAMYTAANGRLLVAGGFDVSGATTNRVQAYDPATDNWNADMPRLGIAVARGAGTCGFYQIGGITGITPFGTTFTASSAHLQGYDQCRIPGIPGTPWLTIAPAQGTIEAGATKRVILVFDGSEQKEFTTTQAQLMVTGYTPYPTPIIPLTVTWDPQPVDLVLSGEVAPTKVRKGDELIYTLTVYNRQAHDHGAAQAVTLTYALPKGISYETASGDAASCEPSDGTVTCDFGTIALGNSKTETLAVNAQQAGKLTSNFTVSAREPESNDDDNHLSLTSVVIGTADLSLDADPASIPVGESGTLTLTLKNTGPDPASEVQIHAAVGGPVTSLQSANTSQGDCATASGVLTCRLGQVNAGKSVTVTLKLFGASAGSSTINAQVNTASNEPDLANNGVTAKVTVEAPPPPDNDGGGGAFGGLALAALLALGFAARLRRRSA